LAEKCQRRIAPRSVGPTISRRAYRGRRYWVAIRGWAIESI